MAKLNSIYKHAKAQAWGMDLVIAAVIFTVGIVIFYFYTLNEPNEAEETISNLFYDGDIIADSLFSEGYPKNWNSENVIMPGILNNDKINETKLENFYILNNLDYGRAKALFNTKYEYYFFLSENMTINSTEIEGIGLKPYAPKNLIKITRFTIYKNKPITAYIYIWK